jgi:radical SAM superfamily enzyme YgiQ (UPF0313 family)
MGGALASFMPREFLSSLGRLDAIVYGEAEETFRDFACPVLRCWRKGATVEQNRRAVSLVR